MTLIKVLDESRTYLIRKGDGEKWGDRDCHGTEHQITGIKVVSKNDYRDLEVGFDIKPRTPYYLLYATYRTADSFGYDEGNIVFIDLFKDINFALKIKEIIAQKGPDNKHGMESSNVKYHTEYNKEITFYKPWIGYFERLEELVVLPVLLEE